MDFFGIYSLPALLEIAAKIYCIVHVLRHDRSLLWIGLILFFPVGGPLIYFIVEIYPELRAGRRGGLSFKLPQTSAGAIAKLKDELEFSNTVENRVKLAQAYAAAKRFDEALETLNECLRGVFKNDVLLTYERAQILFAAGRHAEALADLATLEVLGTKHAVPARLLLEARCHEALGHEADALAVYERALAVSSGEEVRCRYALLLEKVGRVDDARRLFAEITSHARRADGRYRRLNAEWIKTAKERGGG